MCTPKTTSNEKKKMLAENNVQHTTTEPLTISMLFILKCLMLSDQLSIVMNEAFRNKNKKNEYLYRSSLPIMRRVLPTYVMSGLWITLYNQQVYEWLKVNYYYCKNIIFSYFHRDTKILDIFYHYLFYSSD